MTKASALYNFFSSFGLDAYEENSVYSLSDSPNFPYLTYELATDAFSASDTAVTCSLWFRSPSWVQANAKAEEISQVIGRGGKLLDCDGGRILVMRGSPFAKRMGDDSDDMIKRIYINLSTRFYTLN